MLQLFDPDHRIVARIDFQSNLVENETKMKNNSLIREFLSKTLVKTLGMEYISATPILAGGNTQKEDAAGREFRTSTQPLDSFFFHLESNRRLEKAHPDFELDYILGDSDPEENEDKRLHNGNLVYWIPVHEGRVLPYDAAIILPLIHTSRGKAEDNIHEDWLCLRRLGDPSTNNVYDEAGNVCVRSKVGNDVHKEYIDPSHIKGIVISSYSPNLNSVRVAGAMPLLEVPQYQ